jgi:hypothetical protein
MVDGDGCAAALASDGLDRRPAHQTAALFICGTGQCQQTIACFWPFLWGNGGLEYWGAHDRGRAGVRADCSRPEGGQGRAEGPPVGAALTARSVAVSTMVREAPLGLLRSVFAARCPLSWSYPDHAGAGVLAYLGARRRSSASAARWRIGASRRTWCGRSFLVGCPAKAGSNKVAWSWSQIINGWTHCETHVKLNVQAAGANATSPAVRSVW